MYRYPSNNHDFLGFSAISFSQKFGFFIFFWIFWPKSSGEPSDDLGRSFGIMFSPKFQNPTMLVNHFHVFFLFEVSKKHENRTFRASLKPWGPRDPPWMQERQILFRITLTRALYDRMAPQLCLFYVPGQPSKTVKRSVRKKTWSGG